MRTWVKLYTKVNHDPEVGSLTWAQRGIWSALLALAGEIDDRDGDDRPTGCLDTVEHTAWRIRCDLAELRGAVDAFVERGWVEVRNDVVYLTKYRELQERAPSASRAAVAARVQQHRAKVKRECNDVTPSAQRGVTPSESDTESDTESDSDAVAVARKATTATTTARPAREQRMERLFELVRASGVELNSLMAEQYLDLMDECESDFRLLEEAFADAAGAGRAPTPKYLRSIVDRCAREHCRPGQWARGRRPSSNGARASPPGGGPPGSDDEIMPSGLTRRQERLNAIAQAEIAEEVSRGQARAPG